jgi:hypothetical protein
MEMGMKLEPSCMSTACTRPTILDVPTPLAMPAYRVSMSRVRPSRSAHRCRPGQLLLSSRSERCSWIELRRRAYKRHYGVLCSAVDECCDRLAVDMTIDVKHHNPSKRLRIVLHCLYQGCISSEEGEKSNSRKNYVFEISINIFKPDCLFDLSL